MDERLERMRKYSKKLYDLQTSSQEGRMEYNNRKLAEFHNRKKNIKDLRNMVTDLMEQNKELKMIIKEYEEMIEI
jgi:cell fate (sporulation/competence/biofilm development) regulator YlbF (YheA/YmcA/DUF963 family)